MKKLIDKRTGKTYIELDDGTLLECVGNKNIELEEITDSCIYKVGYMSYKNYFSADKLHNFDYKLKDTLTIPIGNSFVTFVVEHINHNKVYFVSKEVVGMSSIKEINNFLDDFTEKMPKELVDRLENIEHIASVNGEKIRFSRKVNLLSLANLGKTNYHFGEDDIIFDGLKTEVGRCKNNDVGNTKWYWTCSPLNLNSSFFMYVGRSGDPYNYYNVSFSNGVVPCFSIMTV